MFKRKIIVLFSTIYLMFYIFTFVDSHAQPSTTKPMPPKRMSIPNVLRAASKGNSILPATEEDMNRLKREYHLYELPSDDALLEEIMRRENLTDEQLQKKIAGYDPQKTRPIPTPKDSGIMEALPTEEIIKILMRIEERDRDEAVMFAEPGLIPDEILDLTPNPTPNPTPASLLKRKPRTSRAKRNVQIPVQSDTNTNNLTPRH